MTYIGVNGVDESTKEYRVTGDWLLEEAESEFDEGDFIQASEKAWGAVSQHLKALATERDWGHDTYAHLAQVADRLAEETGDIEISRLVSVAERLHANFYQTHRSEAAVRSGMDDVKRLVGILAKVGPPVMIHRVAVM